MRNPNLLLRLFNVPLMILPQKADAIIAGLLPRFGLAGDTVTALDHHGLTAPEIAMNDDGASATGYRIDNGIARIEIGGILAQRGGFRADSSQILGYDQLAAQYERAMSDPNVHAIAATFFSPGGEVAGAFALADKIYKFRGKKPLFAVVDELAASAGYLLAAAHDEIWLSPTGYVGSVGIVMRHLDLSAKLEKDGVTVTQIFSGAHKVDGNPFGPLSPDVLARLQAESDATRQLFAEKVALYRGLDTQQVLDTEAAIYRGHEAKQAQFATDIAYPEAVISRLHAKIQSRGFSMSQSILDASADLESARSSAHAEGYALGLKAGAEAERLRISAIIDHPEAKGREPLARALVAQGLSVEAAGTLLAAAPKTEAAAPATPQMSAFERHLQSTGNPDVGLDAPDAEMSTESLLAQAAALLPAHRRAK